MGTQRAERRVGFASMCAAAAAAQTQEGSQNRRQSRFFCLGKGVHQILGSPHIPRQLYKTIFLCLNLVKLQ
ncbi:hypothetical protein JZU54_00150, partial [bacterium]|nr:hypothetical protein [bacterium]